MIYFVKKHKWILLPFVLPYLFLVLISVIRIDYSVTTPGGISKVTSSIDIDGAYQSDGAFYTVYVSSFHKPTILQKWVSDHIEYASVYQIPDNVIVQTDKEIYEVGQFQYSLAMQEAIIYAYKEAQKEIDYAFDGVVVYGISNYNTNQDLELFDVIHSFDGIPITSYNQFVGLISQYKCGESVPVVLKKQDGSVVDTNFQKVSINGVCKYGIMATENYSITDASPQFSLSKTNTSGPSGGLLRALSIYNDLVPQDITDGLKVGGTGTLDIDGNVGYIGGVQQKIVGAIREGLDVFFVPHLSDESYDNYVQALEVYNQFHTSMKLVPVSSFQDALNYLKQMGDQHD